MSKRVSGILILLWLTVGIGAGINVAAGAPLSKAQIRDAAVGVLPVTPLTEKSTPISSLDALEWVTKDPMLTARYGALTGFYNGLVFVAGGAQDTTHPINTGVVEAFDPAANTWDDRYATNPTPRRMAGSGQVQIGASLYVVGGLTEAGVVSGRVDLYRMDTNAWSFVANECEPRYAHGVAAVDFDIYVFGGTDGVTTLASAQKLNVGSGNWTDIADLPGADGWMAGAAAGGKVYAFGGANYPSRVLEYDPGADQWTELANMPLSRVYATAVAAGSRIYLVGGESAPSGGEARTNVYSFTPATGEWTNEGPLPASRVWPAAATSATDIFVIGGLDRTEMPVTFESTCWQATLPLLDVPGPVTNLQVTVYGDPLGALLEWVNPSLTDGGDALTDLDSVCIVRYSCTDTLGTRVACLEAPTIGAAASYMDNGIETMGAYQWEVTPYNTVGEGDARYVSGFVGTEGAYTFEPILYDWTDISVIGDTVDITFEDEVVADVALGFTFNFYGGNYTDINISENGWLSFTSTGGYYINPCLPASGEPNNAIYPFFDDLSDTAGGDIFSYSDGSEFIVQWNDVPFYDSPGESAKFQVVIRADGTIDFIYHATFTGPMGSATVGIEDATGANYLQLCCNGVGTGCPAAGAAYRVNVACPGEGSISGTVVLDPSYGGQVTDVTVTTDLGDTVSPSVTGEYSLTGVSTGTHTVTASLEGYDSEIAAVVLAPFEEVTGVDFTLVRSAPPQVTGMYGSWSYTSGCVEMGWALLSDTTVHQYCVYRSDPGTSTFSLDTCLGADVDLYNDCFAAPEGAYRYYVTAKDVGPSTPQEGVPSETLRVSVGTLPPFWLSGSGYFDDRIMLDWYGPQDSPVRQYYYDDGTNEAGGLGFADHGYYAVRFTFDGPVTIHGLRFFWTDQAAPSTHNKLCIWQADATGAPGTVLSEMSSNQPGGANAFVDYDLDPPLDVTSGDFLVGASQTSLIDYLGLGGDDNEESFVDDAYFYSITGDSGDWATLESALLFYTPMIRIFAEGLGGPAMAIVGPSSDHGLTSESGKDPATGQVLWFPMPAPSRTDAAQWGRGAVRRPAPADGFATVLHYPRHAPAKSSWMPSGDKRFSGHLDEPDYYWVYRDVTDPIYHFTPAESTMFFDVGLPENEEHTYWVKAAYYGADTVVSDSTNLVTVAANMPPGIIPSLDVWFTDVPACSVAFSWEAPTLNDDGTPCVDLDHYRVYRDDSLIEEIPSDITTYSEYVPNPEDPHVYAFTAVDEIPNEGPLYEVNVLCEAMCNYDWVELEGDPEATEITNVGDDDNLGPYPIGFPFEFYGQTYTQFRFAANGFITFVSTSGDFSNDCPLPTPEEPNGAIYALWDDLYPPGGGTFWYKYDAVRGRLIVEWSEVPWLSLSGTATFEIILYNYGGIRFQYNSVAHFESATIGIENLAGTEAVEYCCNGTGIFCPRNEGCICTNCIIPGHLQGLVREYPTGRAVPGALVEVTETVYTAESDSDGFYQILNIPCGPQAIRVTKEGYCTRLDTVDVACEDTTDKNFVMRIPRIQVEPENAIPSVCNNHETCTDTFLIKNIGGRCDLEFSIEVVAEDTSWLHVEPSSGEVAQGQTREITVIYSPNIPDVPEADLDALLKIHHNAADSPYLLFVDLYLSTEIRQVGIPTEFVLHQNFPNPFNPVTTIYFDLPAREHVQLEIFNVIGQKVVTLVNEPMAPGYHVARFDATRLPSGLYFYRIQAGDYAALKKMMLIK